MEELQRRIEELRTLTPRQREVLRLRCQGKSLHEIADTLVFTESAAKRHMGNIFAKLGIDSEWLSPTGRHAALSRYCEVLATLPDDAFGEMESRPQAENEEPPTRALIVVDEDERALMEQRSETIHPETLATTLTKRPERRPGVSPVLLAVSGVGVGAVLIAVVLLLTGSRSKAVDAPASQPRVAAASATALSTSMDIAPSATTIATASRTATPQPTAMPPPSPGTVLYEANWSSGMAGWPAVEGWKALDGMLINDGTAQGWIPAERWVRAPYAPGEVRDYAVEAEIRVVTTGCPRFGIVARSTYSGQIMEYCVYNDPEVELASIGSSRTQLKVGRFNPKDTWHTYRLVVKSNQITFSVDGAVLLEATDNRALSGGNVGLWVSSRTQLAVRSFKVIAQ